MDVASNLYQNEDGFIKAFRSKFETEGIPEVLNNQQKIYIMGAEIDATTERIIEYLSDVYGVGINAATFQMFKGKAGAFMTRIYTKTPEEVDYSAKTKHKSKKTPPPTIEMFQEAAKKAGFEEVYNHLFEWASYEFDTIHRRKASVAFNLEKAVVFNLSPFPEWSDPEYGLNAGIYVDRLAKYCDVKSEVIMKYIPKEIEKVELNEYEANFYGAYYQVWFKTMDEAEKFTKGITNLFRKVEGGGNIVKYNPNCAINQRCLTLLICLHCNTAVQNRTDLSFAPLKNGDLDGQTMGFQVEVIPFFSAGAVQDR